MTGVQTCALPISSLHALALRCPSTHTLRTLAISQLAVSSGWFSSKRLQWLWIGTVAFFGVAVSAAVGYAALKSIKFILLFFPASVPLAYSVQHEVSHKPQNYKMAPLATCLFLFLSLSIILATYFDYPIFILPYIIEALGVLFACWMISKLSNSMADTGEIDAIAWLLITTPPQYPATFFKKAGQMTGSGSIGRHYRPRLLESLMPHLTLLITSERHSSDTHSASSKLRQDFRIQSEREQSDVLNGSHGLPTSQKLRDEYVGLIDEATHLKNLEIYTACLARLSEFEDYEGSFWRLREDAMRHPKLEQPLIKKLVELAKRDHDVLRSAATKVLNNYKLDTEGNPVESQSPAIIVPARSVATVLRSAATLMINVSGLNSQDQGHSKFHPATRVEPAHSSEENELEEVKSEIGASGMC